MQGSRHVTVLASVGLALAINAVAAPQAGALPPAASRRIDFATDIQPIFRKNCTGCHNAALKSGGLRLDDREAALQGGYTGSVIKPGDSAGSLLIQLVGGLKKEMAMPKGGQPLPPEQISLLRGWIDQGAQWPAATSAGKLPGAPRKSSHWSFQPVRKMPAPAVRKGAWVRNPIDAFILARLEAENVEPSPEASRATLIRRVSLDLIGLPPTPQEISAFLADTRGDAYERLVDRLLSSPHYGEKWARHWLDLARYADSDGYETDQLRPHAWRYRHWVVEALNRDLPFDQFTIQQVAGDLLPDATVEQRIATGFHRNTLSNREGGADLEEYRVEQVVDRASTVSTVWLGLTAGCARCHDHKYDAISQKEFYQLYAFFNSAEEVNIEAPLPGDLGPYLRGRAIYEKKRRELLAPVKAEVAEMQAAWEQRVLEADANPGKDHRWDRAYELLGLTWGGNLGEGQLEGTRILKLPSARRTESQRERLEDYFIRRGSIVDPGRFKELKLADIAKQLDELAKNVPTIARAPVMETNAVPRETRIHLRGNFRDPGIPVVADVPAVLPPLPSGDAPPRLRLAQWLVSRENPLTARVAVNRAWQEFFGRGLVSTPEDFGSQGDKPSHPELLDWLATEFRERGWSQKALHKLIVMSAVYRQSSNARPELHERDPNNVLLARQSRLRLPAELIRDASLAVSGLLSYDVGGPSVRPPQPASVSQQGFDNKWIASEGSNRYRRGLYTFLQRTSPFAQSATFDLPDSGRTCARRERSNTPLQALTLLNDEVFFEAAQALAVRIIGDGTGGNTDRIRAAFRLCLGREPDSTEMDQLSSYLLRQEKILRNSSGEADALLGVSLEGVEPVERGACVALSSVLLNLDEFITRE